MITSDRVRPVFVHIEAHVRAYVFLCMLAYYVEWHIRRRLAPILFDEDDPEAAKARRASPVEPAKPSPSARSKAANKRTPDGEPTHSLHTLLADLSTIALNDVSLGEPGSFKVVTTLRPGRGRPSSCWASTRLECSQPLAGRNPGIALPQRKNCDSAS